VQSASRLCGGIFDYDFKKERLQEVQRELEQPEVWSDQAKAQALGQEKTQLEAVLNSLDHIESNLADVKTFLDLHQEDPDPELLQEAHTLFDTTLKNLETLEFQRMFSGKMDPNNAYLDIQSGSGGTEAQDWAEMILRMYLRWCEAHQFKVEIESHSPGEVAGIKGATLHISGPYAYGWLRTETGVHRLVRKSPFDSGNRRHTSFASVFVSPEIDDDIEITINPADLRVDTYRASGAGGQHINRTDSAIRITHIPTNTVVQCQSDRSQHKNRDQAMKQLKAKLYELELMKKKEEQQALEATKAEIGWGNQIRSYVLDQSRIKDLRTNVENTDTQAVLDGKLDPFIQASLKQGL
jgi:peptide chain release factor 2